MRSWLALAVGCAVMAFAAAPALSSSIDPRNLPLGDGKLSSSPRAGYVDSCQTSFPNLGGAFRDGPWIHSDHTWNAAAKISVQGDVAWPQATYKVVRSGSHRIITSAGLPTSSGTGIFPIASTDPAYQYDRNPNSIRPHTLRIVIPAGPQRAHVATCLGGGPIGILKDGVALFDALDGEGRDAVAHEILDRCAGHPERTGLYHHHDIPSCMLNKTRGRSTLVGYALDGFGIFVERDSHGKLLTDSALDGCHGRTSTVRWNGHSVKMYHYVATEEYPYTLGCYRGTPSTLRSAP